MAIQFKSATGFDYVSAATPLPVTIVSGSTGFVINGTNPSAVAITAGGSDQNITLTPSGTGSLVIGVGGSSSNPSLRWADADTGIYSEGAGVVNITANGTQLGQFRASGPQGLRMIGSAQIGSNGSLILFSSDTTALTLDTSQNATFAGTAITPASGSTKAGLRIPHGAAPSSPVNGDMWTTTAGLFVRINGVTVGPLS